MIAWMLSVTREEICDGVVAFLIVFSLIMMVAIAILLERKK